MKKLLVGLVFAAGLGMIACQGDTTGTAGDSQLAAVSPTGGATGVTVTSKVTIEFTHAMMSGMEQYAALHEGSVTGAVVGGSWTWAADQRTLTFAPTSPLKSQTAYTIHVGGAMRDAQNHMVGLGNGMGMGGQWANGGMMGNNSSMMGAGWLMPDGNYGMLFSFRTI